MATQIRLNTQALAGSLTNAEVATAAAIALSKLAAPTLGSSTYAVPANADQYLADNKWSIQTALSTASAGSSLAGAASNLASLGSVLASNASVIGSNASVTASSALATAILGSNLASNGSVLASNASVIGSNASVTASSALATAILGSNLASVASSIAVAASATASTGAAVRHSHKYGETPTVGTASSSLYTLVTAPINWPRLMVNGLVQERAYDWTAASSIATLVTFLAGAIPTTDDRVRADIIISN